MLRIARASLIAAVLFSACSGSPTQPGRQPEVPPPATPPSGEDGIVSASAWRECSVPWYGTSCTTGTTPANRSLNRIWFGIETDWAIAEWKVTDLDTGVVVGSGRVARNTSHRQGIYGLYGNRYQLRITLGQFPTYAFICDC
jgi:hypothetical protein